MLLHHAKVQFEDIRVDLNDVKYQNTDVFRISNLPILEFCNHRMTGAVAVLRSLGRLYGYYPLNDTEA
jgi:hypothetical protein